MDNVEAVLKARLDHLEDQLAALFPDRYVRFAQAASVGVPPEVLDLLRAGKKIAAVNAYSQTTGVGLKEAKLVVDSLDA